MDDIDRILSSIDLEEEVDDMDEMLQEWYCEECEHGPMMDEETHCNRCGVKNRKARPKHDETDLEDEDMELEEIW